MFYSQLKMVTVGSLAGIVNGLFGAGGGMVLVPLLSKLTDLEEEEIFPASISIILPMCFVTLLLHSLHTPLPLQTATPYMIGSLLGGIVTGFIGGKIPTTWLHRILGVLVLWGGLRYLC